MSAPPRPTRWYRWAMAHWPALAFLLVGAPVAIVATLGTLYWPGRPFPGFFVMENGLVPAIGDYRWSGFVGGVPLLSQVVAADDEPVRTNADVYAHVAPLPVGTPVRYRFVTRGGTVTRDVATMRFRTLDYWATVGAFIICGWVALVVGIGVGFVQPKTAAARAFLVQGSVTGLFAFTGSALYHPGLWWLTPLHCLVQCVLPASFVHLALCFPVPRRFVMRRPAWLALPYLVSLPVLMWFVRGFYGSPPDARPYVAVFLYIAIGIGLMMAVPVYAYWENRTPRVREQLNVVIPGVLAATAIALWLNLNAVLRTADVPANLMAILVPLLYVSVAYALVRYDLFDVDALVKQAAIYGTLTVGITAAYAGALALASTLAPGLLAGRTPLFSVGFVVLVGILFEPMRARVQRVVDRVFFRRRVDYRVTVRELSAALTSLLDREEIEHRVATTVSEGFQVESFSVALWEDDATRLYRMGPNGGRLETLPPSAFSALRSRLGEAPAQPFALPDTDDEEPAPEFTDERAAMATLAAVLVVPLAIGGRVTGAFALGRRRSGRPFSREDLELLATLAAQSAIALANARSYHALQALNRELEHKVRERTAQLETSYAELKSAQGQLVQSEKMASLGVLVAGVAHEINNPVSFIVNNTAPLQERLLELRRLAAAHPELAIGDTLDDMTEAVEVIARGAERTAGIVRDLRVFSRLGDTETKAVDLHEGLEMCLRLLRPRLGDRITVHRDLGDLPLVESAPGQLNQVFMNVLANACDAIAERGNLWVTTRVAGDEVTVAIRDDGAGIAPEHLAKIFDPFFTTKPPGKGTGLGLAITHGIVAAHGGRIEVASVPGKGTTVTIVLSRVQLRQGLGVFLLP